jgi:hypothetical protein
VLNDESRRKVLMSLQLERAPDQSACEAEATLPTCAAELAPVPRAWTALLCVVVAALRYTFSAGRSMFTVGPDEHATGGMARFLSGGHFNMLGAGVYRPALGTLLAPLYAVVHDPSWQVRLGLLTTATIGGLSVWWLVQVVRRLTSFGVRGVLIVSGLIAVTPSSLVASAHIWAEPLVSLAFLGALLALMKLCERPTWRSGLTAILWALLGYSAHGRLLVLLAVVSAVAVGSAVHRQLFGRAAILGATAVCGYGAVTVYTRWVVEHVWEYSGEENSAGTIVRHLGDPLTVLDAALGQLWYLLCSSALLAGFGLLVLGGRSWSGEGRVRSDALVVLTLTVPLFCVSAAFMSGRDRPDYLIYGRYNDAVVWPVLAVGAAWLWSIRPSWPRRTQTWAVVAVLGVAVEFGLIVFQLHQNALRRDDLVPDMVAGAMPVIGRSFSLSVPLITGVAVVTFAALALSAAARSSLVRAGVVVVVVAVAGLRTWHGSVPSQEVWKSTAAVREILELGIDLDRPIGVSIMPDEYGPALDSDRQVLTALNYEWYLPELQFVFDNGPSDSVGPYVFAVSNDALLTREGGEIVWQDPTWPVALWREPD